MSNWLSSPGFTPERIPLGEFELLYQADFLAPAAADLLMVHCRSLPWEQSRIRLFGRWHAIPRLNSWIADEGISYRYSGTLMTRVPWTDPLLEMRLSLERQLSTGFNNVLANWYRDGNDSMGWHSDDEPELGPAPIVAAISLGAERPLKFRPRAGGISLGLCMAHGSLLVMPAGLQAAWQHSLPRRANKEERISLTFRQIVSAR